MDYTVNPENGEMSINWEKTKCFPLEPCHAHLFINLKGRDPHGIVEPEEYEKVQQEVMDAMLAWRDPETGERVMELVLPRQLSSQLGVFERQGYERVGMDFFISQNKYTAADRDRILDTGSVDPVIALEAQKRALEAGLIKK